MGHKQGVPGGHMSRHVKNARLASLSVPVSNQVSPRPGRLEHVPKRPSPPQEADDGVLQPAGDVRRDQGQLAAGQGAVVRRRVLPLAHRQQRDPLALCAGTWTT